MPFRIWSAKAIKLCFKKLLSFETNLEKLYLSKYVIICIGTPINSKLKPNLKDFFNLIKKLKKYINQNQIIIVRSSIYPGTIEKNQKGSKK